MTKNEFSSYLAEGIHTAFRKGSSDPAANQIWRLIRDMPDKEWGNVVSFIVDGVWPALQEKKGRKT